MSHWNIVIHHNAGCLSLCRKLDWLCYSGIVIATVIMNAVLLALI
jgi:hypothetical protein